MENKTLTKPVVVIERLSVFSLPLALGLCWRHSGGYFVHASYIFEKSWMRRTLETVCNLRQLRYEDVPGSYFEIQSRATSGINDTCFNMFREQELDQNLYFLRRLHDSPYMETALRRVLMNTFTLDRIKTAVFLRHLLAQGDRIVFVPQDNLASQPWAPAELSTIWHQTTIPLTARLINKIQKPFAIFGTGFYVAGALIYLLFQRGISFSSPRVQTWNVGYDVLNEGIAWDKPYHFFFIFGTGDLAPQAVLHVVRNRLEEPRTRAYFEKEKIPYVEVSKRPIPLGYLIKTVLWTYTRRFYWLLFRHLIRNRNVPLLRSAAEIVFPNLLRAEILELTHQTEVFVSRDEYSVTHILRTMLYDARAGKTIGFSHGDDCFPYAAIAYICDHVFCFPGEFHERILARNSKLTKEKILIGAGVCGLDITHQRIEKKELPAGYEALRKKYKLVGVFPSSYQENHYLTREHTFRFYRAVFALLDKHPDIALVIRPKMKDQELLDPEFQEMVRRAGDRVVVEDKIWTYELLPVFDLVICISLTSVGLESMMAGIPVIYFDEKEFIPHPYSGYDERLVARSPEGLAERVKGWLENKNLIDPKILERIRREHGFRFDGKVAERFREIIQANVPKKALRSSNASVIIER